MIRQSDLERGIITPFRAFLGIFSYAGMPYEMAEDNLRLFASRVMPELKKHVSIEDQLIARAGAGDPPARA